MPTLKQLKDEATVPWTDLTYEIDLNQESTLDKNIGTYTIVTNRGKIVLYRSMARDLFALPASGDVLRVAWSRVGGKLIPHVVEEVSCSKDR